jgi:hypothetical protein
MGNAFIAVSDDGTAASWNPAGLAQLRKPEFSIVHSTSRRDVHLEGYRARDGTAAYTNLATASSVASLEFASAAVPFGVAGRPVTLQAGWRRLYQLDSSTMGDMRRVPISPQARPESLLRFASATEGGVDLWSLAGATQFTSRLSLGFSLDFYRGRWEDRGDANESPGVDGTTDFSSFRTSNGIRGSNLTFGLLLAYPKVRVGLVHHGALRSGYEVTESLRSSLAAPRDLRLGPEGLTLRFPRSLGLGVAWLPRPRLRFALDFTFDDWTGFLVEGGPGAPAGGVSGFDGLPPELSATRDTVTVNLGLERLFAVQGRFVPLRLGFTHEPQGGRDALLRDDADQTVLAAGTGLNSNSLKLDVALEYRWGRFRNTRNLSPAYLVGAFDELGLPPPPEAEGTTRIRELRLKVSLIYRLTSTDKLRDLARKVFGS